MARRRKRVPAARWRRSIVPAMAVSMVCLIGVSARSWRRHEPPAEVSRAIAGRVPLRTPELTVAANELLASVKRRITEDPTVPRFARERIEWLTAQQRAGTLKITLLKNAASASLDCEDLMAAGTIEGRQVIVIAQTRFADFLAETGPASAPFSRQQQDDFMLGLLHETVHLERSDLGDLRSFESRLDEEMRAWEKVDVNVARPLRSTHEPLGAVFIAEDEAIRSCGDQRPCQALRDLLAPSEARR
jgi:hypothetical protein